MAHDLTVNTTRTNLATALVTSKTQPYSPTTFPQLCFGETVSASLYLIDGDSYDARSGAADYSPRIVITLDDLSPKGGTFTLSDGTATTSALDWDATAAEVEDALNAMNSQSGPFGDNVTVQKLANGVFNVKFDTNAARNLLTVDADGLNPVSSGSVLPVVEGSATARELQLIQVKADPLVFSDGGDQIANGWTVELDANNGNFLQAVASGDISADFSIQVIGPESTVDQLAKGPVILKQANFDVLALSGISYPNLLSNENVVNQRLDITGLDGGTVTDLNFLATVELETNYTALLGVTVGANVPGKTWSLQDGTDANNPAGGVVRPLDFDASTNAKVWKVTQ